MKHLRIFVVIALAGIFIATGIQSCKKGPNDPGISFSSRKGRVAGTWVITIWIRNGIEFINEVEDTSVNFTGCGPSGSCRTVVTTDRNYEYIFDADGGYILTAKTAIKASISYAGSGPFCPNDTSFNVSDTTAVFIGSWNFTSSVGETKNKEQMIITDPNDFLSEIYDIDRLAKKEMILKRVYTDFNDKAVVETITMTKQ